MPFICRENAYKALEREAYAPEQRKNLELASAELQTLSKLPSLPKLSTTDSSTEEKGASMPQRQMEGETETEELIPHHELGEKVSDLQTENYMLRCKIKSLSAALGAANAENQKLEYEVRELQDKQEDYDEAKSSAIEYSLLYQLLKKDVGNGSSSAQATLPPPPTTAKG